ncbi:MAG TPA: peptide ABC transporter substrate-binding protein [Candidatus Dormibacteraeota bacterium]|nr:peptide ABC transporter substrate-binding protein [Candidatus Dormibacteraeota bacterium]
MTNRLVRLLFTQQVMRAAAAALVVLVAWHWLIPLAEFRPSPQILRLALPGSVGTLDPALSSQPAEATVGRQIAEPLLGPRADVKDVQPLAADHWHVSADGLTYTFHLRPSRYSDGTMVRAQDFVFEWRRLVDPRVGSRWSGLFTSSLAGASALTALDPGSDSGAIDEALSKVGLAAPDNATFVVTLSHPQASFKWMATLWAGVPVTPQGLTSQTFNGPYRVGGRVGGGELILVPSPTYSGRAKAALSRIEMRLGVTASAGFSLYQEGLVDMVGLAVAQGPSGALHRTPLPTLYWINFNTRQPPFDNPNVRRAFALAVDRTDLTAQVAPGAGLFPRGQLDGVAISIPAQPFDPNRARSALAGAQVDPAILARVQLMVRSDSPGSQEVADLLSAGWRTTLGLDVVKDSVDSATLVRRLGTGDFQIQVLGGWQGDYPDQQELDDQFLSTSPLDYSGFKSAQFDDLVTRADASSDPTARSSLYQQATSVLADGTPVVALYQQVQWSQIKPYVSGVLLTPFDGSGFPGSVFAATIHIQPH